MKKTLTLFLVVLSLAALAGCSDPADDPAPPVTSSSVETSTPETDNPLLLSDFEILDVISGGGSVIGTRGVCTSKKPLCRSSPPLISPPILPSLRKTAWTVPAITG